MTRILLAEDSQTQSLQIRALLEQSQFEVDAVSTGKEVVQRLESHQRYDLILTDMMMPGINGLQVVRAVRFHYPGTPVVLITGQGTDALVIEALEDGAAGYVSKSQMQEKLIEEIDQVLHAAEIDRSYELLLGCLQRNEFVFTLGNDTRLIGPLINLLLQMMSGLGLSDSTDRVRIGLALEHALLNAMFRGNLEITSAQLPRARDALRAGQAEGLVASRASEAPYRDRRVNLDVSMDRREARFVIRDEGPGFDISQVPRPGDAARLDCDEGQGLFRMTTFMDEVTFNGLGNEVTLIKRRDGETVPKEVEP